MGGGYVPPHLRGGAGPSASGRGRGGRSGAGRGNTNNAPVGAEAVVDAALKSKETAERKLSRVGAVAALSSRDTFTEVANDLRSALEDSQRESAKYWVENPDSRHSAILALGETLVQCADATLVASRVGPLKPDLLNSEAAARRTAVTLYNQAIEVLTALCTLREKYVAEQKSIAGKKPTRLYQQNAFSIGGSNGQKNETQFLPVAVDVANVAAGARANALAALGDIFVSSDELATALPVLIKAEHAYESVVDQSVNSVNKADKAYEKLLAEHARDGAGTSTHSVALQQQNLAVVGQRRVRASTACLDALWNLGDARGKLAECYGSRGEFAEASRYRSKAFEAFEAATSRADSNVGDDLGGLVYDWGCVGVAHGQSLLEEAQVMILNLRSKDASSGVTVDASGGSLDRNINVKSIHSKFTEITTTLRWSDEKLTRAAEFSQGDCGPLTARGELLQTKAETVRCGQEFGLDISIFFDQDGVSRMSSLVDVLCFPLRVAIDAHGGAFGSALKIDQNNFDAVIGVAESYVECGKVFVSIAGDMASAHVELKRAWEMYQKALQIAQQGGAGNGAHTSGDDPGAAKDRLQVAYAAACAAHMAGESETAGELIANVLACGGCTLESVQKDEDLVGLRPRAWGG